MATKQAFSVVLMALMVSGVFFVYLGTCTAQSIIKPSIPDFTVAYLDKSYFIPPTTTTDPYNGKTITIPGSLVKASAIEIRIKNEAFTPQTTELGNKVGYYYNIRWKGHFEDNWHYAFQANYGSGYFPRNEGAETVFSTDGQYTCGFDIPDVAEVRIGDQIDFQVEAMIGYVMDPGPFESEVFEGQVSGWSGTQILTITGTSSVSPSPTVVLTTTPMPSELPTSISTPIPTIQSGSNVALAQLGLAEVVAVAALGLVAVLVVVVVVLGRRIRRLERKVAP